jgi:hypothetical protein
VAEDAEELLYTEAPARYRFGGCVFSSISMSNMSPRLSYDGPSVYGRIDTECRNHLWDGLQIYLKDKKYDGMAKWCE